LWGFYQRLKYLHNFQDHLYTKHYKIIMLSAERYFHSALLQRFLGSYVAVIMHTVYLVISMCRRETFRWVSVFRIPTPTRTCAANPRRKIHGRIRINTLYRSEINRTRFRQIFSQSALRTISSTFNKREIVFIVG
jgi:hypothetical protein